MKKIEWHLTLGGEKSGFTVTFETYEVPNFFQRWMSSVFFGFKWAKIEEEV